MSESVNLTPSESVNLTPSEQFFQQYHGENKLHFNKACQDIAEILLKVALNTKQSINQSIISMR